jgi:(2Fe-2S) ferredoxin
VPPEELAPRLGIGRLSRHILVCCGPACCDAAQGARTWGAIKRRIAVHNAADPEGPTIYRTRCDCLGLCDSGPIAVVYPEGTWYARLTPASGCRVVEEHLVEGRPVGELSFATDPLRPADAPGGDPDDDLHP